MQISKMSFLTTIWLASGCSTYSILPRPCVPSRVPSSPKEGSIVRGDTNQREWGNLRA